MHQTSPLLRLPRELRNHIFSILFDSTRISYGRRIIVDEGQDIIRDIRPAVNSLAILRTCSQIHAEAQDAWIGRVTFSFENNRDALVKLASIFQANLSKIRHVRVIECTPYAFNLEEGGGETFPLSTLITSIPGLRLETLTIVRDTWTDSLNFFADYVRYSRGWRELRCVLSSTFCLQASQATGTGTENQTIDHETVKAIADQCSTSIKIFRGLNSSIRGSIFDPGARQLLDTDGLKSLSQNICEGETDSIGCESKINQEVLLIARRNDGADIGVAPCGGPPPYRYSDSRTSTFSEYKGNMAFKDLLDLYQVDRYIHPDAIVEQAPIEPDSYREVDDFIWPQNGYSRLLPEEYMEESLRKQLEEK